MNDKNQPLPKLSKYHACNKNVIWLVDWKRWLSSVGDTFVYMVLTPPSSYIHSMQIAINYGISIAGMEKLMFSVLYVCEHTHNRHTQMHMIIMSNLFTTKGMWETTLEGLRKAAAFVLVRAQGHLFNIFQSV